MRLAKGLPCGASPSRDSTVVMTLGTLLTHLENSARDMCCLAEPACAPQPAPAGEGVGGAEPASHVSAAKEDWTLTTRTACDCC